MNTITQKECKDRFVKSLAAFVAEMRAIDTETPWSETEPYWWLNLKNLEGQCIAVMRALKEGSVVKLDHL